jgi:intron-binding protein aquarius
MNVAAVGKAVPDWLHDVFLGYGDAAAAHYKNLPTQIRELDMVDTFLNGAHAMSCFPGQEVVFETTDGARVAPEKAAALQAPFKVRFEIEGTCADVLSAAVFVCVVLARWRDDATLVNGTRWSLEAGARCADAVRAAQHGSVSRGRAATKSRGVHTGSTGGHSSWMQPRAHDGCWATWHRKDGCCRADHFQPVPQLPESANALGDALEPRTCVRAGCYVVRMGVLSCATSPRVAQALNDLFEKIMQRDIKERDLLRLGAGERDLDTESDFSKIGRVNATLARRVEVLAEVDRLGVSLRVRERPRCALAVVLGVVT